MMTTKPLRYLTLLLLPLITACSGDSDTGPGPVTPEPPPPQNPVPTISGVSPESIEAGSGTTTITVDGGGFGSFSAIHINGAARTTTPGSATRLTTSLRAEDIAAPGTVSVTVVNAGPGGGTSAPRTVTITPKPVASIAVTADSDTLLAGASISVQATVTDRDGSTLNVPVQWSSSSTTVATVSAAGRVDARAPGRVTITATAGEVAGSLQLTVAAPAPTISTVSPDTIEAGTGATTVTVSGTGFGEFSTIHINGTARTTTLVSATQVTASLNAADIAAPGAVSVTVVNGGPGGGTSAARNITITPKPAASVTVTAASDTLLVGQTITLQAIVKDRDGDTMNVPVQWSSSSDAIATVNASGVVQAIAPGSVTIAASAGAVSGTVRLTVAAPVTIPSWVPIANSPIADFGGTIHGWTRGLGRTWVLTGPQPIRLHSSADGITWTTLDLTSLGLPPQRLCGIWGDICVASLGATSSEVVVTMMLRLANNGVNAAGHGGDLWTVRGDGQTWTVEGPSVPGLNQAAPSISSRSFRLSHLTGSTSWNNRVVTIGVAQWWTPFSTGDQSFYTLTTTGPGSWQAFARDIVNFSGWNLPGSIAAGDLGFIVAGFRSGSLQLWHSPDGTDWSLHTPPAPNVSLSASSLPPTIVQSSKGVVVMMRSGDGRTRAWHSTDAVTWTDVELPGANENRAPVALTVNGRFIVHNAGGMRSWISADGLTWKEIPQSITLNDVFVVGNRVFGVRRAGGVYELLY